MEGLAQVVADAGGAMEFSAFVAEARSRGLDARLWLQAKHRGIITTAIEDGVHVVRLPAPAPEGA